MTKKWRIEGRRTVGISSAYSGSREPGFYAHMFVEDIHAGLMGFRHLAEDDERRVEVEGDETGKALLGAVCTSLSDYPRHELGDTVQSAIESIALRLAWFGEAIYEICGTGAEIALASVMPYRLFRVPGGFVQLIPRTDRQRFEGRRYAFLPRSCAWRVRLPRRVGGSRGHRRLLNQLTAVSQPAPEFWTRELESGKFATEFVFSDYNGSRDAYIARLTRRWGWNRRDSSGTYNTEPFYFFRTLRFRQVQAVVRDHIVDEMNKFLRNRLVNARFRLYGYPSPTKIEQLLREVATGSLHYVEALRAAQ